MPLEQVAAELAARDCTLGDDNVAGGLTIDVLFEEHGDAVERDSLLVKWSGDRFQHLVCAGFPELVWVTRWDDAAAAAEFAARYAAIADSVASSAGFSGAARVLVDGRTAVVLSPTLADLGPPILAGLEIRAYQSFDEWTADDCFPESPCPTEQEEKVASPSD